MRNSFFPWIGRGCLVGAGLVSSTACFAQQDLLSKDIPSPAIPTGPWTKATYQIAKTETAPRIDGNLDDACWKSGLHADGFYRFRTADAVHEQTEAWICADKSRLYVAFHCKDSHPELIRAHETQREGNVDQDDYVGLAIDTQGTRRNVSQFTVTARGTQQTQLEGGTAENLSWAGDWTAATQKVADGWTAEISIPFAMLRYPKGAHNFPLVLLRQIARETNPEIWPHVPLGGDSNPLQYLNDFVGVEPPYYPPHLVFLPYTLATTGKTTALRTGLDVKYPISTTLTGVATLFPDFETVEQAVQDLSFSYTEKYLPDRRPFFAEGNGFWPDSFLFYSQRIANVDEGLKVVGKQGRTTIGALATNAEGANGQSAFFSTVSQDFGLFSNLGATVLGTNLNGQPANRVAQISGSYGWKQNGRQMNFNVNDTNSWVANGRTGYNDWFQLATDSPRGKVSGDAYYTETDPNFVNQLGLVQEVDVAGGGFDIHRNGGYDKGPIQRDYFGIGASSFRHKTGGFFHDSVSSNSYIGLRNGWGFQVDADFGKREDFHDNTISSTVMWGQKTLFQQGSLNYQVGRRENLPYRFVNLNQGVLIGKGFSLNAMYNGYHLGDFDDSQTVLSGTFRLNSQEALGGRLVQHDGKTNIYLSYGRRTRHGTDIFFLIGDPNSPNTRGVFTVKLVKPF